MSCKEVAVGIARPNLSTPRLRFTLRMFAVAVSFPAIVLVILCATLLLPITSPKSRYHTALRLWLNVLDWVKGVPVGYTYWVTYQAPVMLDEIAVHHDE